MAALRMPDEVSSLFFRLIDTAQSHRWTSIQRRPVASTTQQGEWLIEKPKTFTRQGAIKRVGMAGSAPPWRAILKEQEKDQPAPAGSPGLRASPPLPQQIRLDCPNVIKFLLNCDTRPGTIGSQILDPFTTPRKIRALLSGVGDWPL